jgi:hypothetical protein
LPLTCSMELEGKLGNAAGKNNQQKRMMSGHSSAIILA